MFLSSRRTRRAPPMRGGVPVACALVLLVLAGCGRDLRRAPEVPDRDAALGTKGAKEGADTGHATRLPGAPAPGTRFSPALVALALPTKARARLVALGFLGADGARVAAWPEPKGPAVAWFGPAGGWLLSGDDVWRNETLPESNVTASIDLWSVVAGTARARWSDAAGARQPPLLALSSRSISARSGKDVVLLRVGSKGLERIAFPWNDEDDGVPLGAGATDEGDGLWLATANTLYLGSPSGGGRIFREAWRLELGAVGAVATSLAMSGLKGSALTNPDAVTLVVLGKDGTALQGRLATPATAVEGLGEALLFTDRPAKARLEPAPQATATATVAATDPNTVLTFADVAPAIGKGCVSCHGTAGYGGFRNADQEISWTGTRKARLMEVIEGNRMPPPSSAQSQAITAKEKADVLRWLGSVP